MDCVEQCLACLNSTISGSSGGTGSNSAAVLAVVSSLPVVCSIALGVWHYLLQHPRAKQWLGLGAAQTSPAPK